MVGHELETCGARERVHVFEVADAGLRIPRVQQRVERLVALRRVFAAVAEQTPYRDGTTHIVLEPVDFMARLAALVPPRVHLTRYHGVFAPHAALRAAVTPAGRGSGAHRRAGTAASRTPRHLALTWARRLQRVFNIEIEQCARCGGQLAVRASIEDPEVIARILAHRRERGDEDPPVASLGPRAPPSGRSGMLF
jgi:hypothetical protein